MKDSDSDSYYSDENELNNDELDLSFLDEKEE